MKKGMTVWFTGMSGTGKTTIANLLTGKIRAIGLPVVQLDGDDIRATPLCADLGFSPVDRNKNVARVAAVAKLLNDQGVHAIVSLISPLTEAREKAKAYIGPENFRLIHMTAPIDLLEERDTKGLYKAPPIGFTHYEPPTHPSWTIVSNNTLRQDMDATEVFLNLIEDLAKYSQGRPVRHEL